MPARKRRAGRATEKGGLRRPPLAGALACRRSTAVLTNGTFVPRARRRARLPETEREAADLAATRRLGHSDAPRAPVVVPAGMMPEPPGCGVYRSARGRRTRSACREYPPRRRPLKSEIGCGYCHSSGEVKRRRILFDESEPIKARVLPEGRGTPMIRIGN